MATRLSTRDTAAEAKMSKTEWTYAAKRTLTEFSRAGGTDLAAQLTYFIVLAIAPSLLALFSLAALVLSGFQDEIVGLITDAVAKSNIAKGSGDLSGPIESTLKSLLGSTSSGTIALIIGIVTALWSASAFVKAFSRASNKIYRVEETRGPVKFNLSMLAVTAALIVGILLLFISMLLNQSMVDSLFGPIFSAIQMPDLLSFLTDTFIPIWAWVKWPFMLALLFAVVSLLYWATPNLEHKYRFISPGGIFAIVGIALALVALSIYMSTAASYSSYGAIGGVMAVLFVLWVVSIVLILGAALTPRFCAAASSPLVCPPRTVSNFQVEAPNRPPKPTSNTPRSLRKVAKSASATSTKTKATTRRHSRVRTRFARATRMSSPFPKATSHRVRSPRLQPPRTARATRRIRLRRRHVRAFRVFPGDRAASR